MNVRTEKKIAVMQAFVNGKQIERAIKCNDVGWELDLNPSWNWSNYDYRIKL